jgi:hypothetical protein
MQNRLFPDEYRNASGNILFPAVCETPITWGDFNKNRADGFKAIVNPETGKVFSVVSTGYKLIRHEDAADRLENILNEHPEFGKYSTKTEIYNEGARLRRTYCFYQRGVEIDKGDLVNPELHLSNSYDRSWPFTVLLGAFRLICNNGLVVGIKFIHLKKRHAHNFDQIDIENQVSKALERFYLQAGQWSKWSELQLPEKTYDKVMKTMKFGQDAMKQINQRIETESEGYRDDGLPILSLWAFYNVLTWYITHRAVSLNHRVEMERRLRSSLASFW